MSTQLTIKSILCLAIAFIHGCTWVKPVEDAKGVAILSADETAACKKIGAATVKVKSSLGILKRHDGKVQKELETLAKNEAVKLDGDTISPASPITNDGEQSFNVYQCR